MEKKEIIIEHLKTALIVLLFLTAGFLLSFFGRSISLNSFFNFQDLRMLTSDDTDAVQPELSQLVLPFRICLSYGRDENRCSILSFDDPLQEENIFPSGANRSSQDSTAPSTASADDRDSQLFTSMIRAAAFFPAEGCSLEEVDPSVYPEVLLGRSLTAEFRYTIPADSFAILFDFPESDEWEEIERFCRFTFSAEDGALYVEDADAGLLYRLTIVDENRRDVLIQWIHKVIHQISAENTSTFEPVSHVFDTVADLENNTLFPVSAVDDMDTIPVSQEYDFSREPVVRRLEHMFFPSGLDFVRKISRNRGTLLYMYGYSERVLQLNQNGSVHYSEELDLSRYQNVDFLDALSTVTSYVTDHGGWQDIYGHDLIPCIDSWEPIVSGEDSYPGYRFCFGLRYGRHALVYTSDEILEIDVYGDQVTSYYRYLVYPETSVLSSSTASPYSTARNPETGASPEAGTESGRSPEDLKKILLDHTDTICSILSGRSDDHADTEKGKDDYLSDSRLEILLSHIESSELTYVLDSSSDEIIFPAWNLQIDGVTFRFDAKSGQWINPALTGEVHS